jgi:hypothetical protein
MQEGDENNKNPTTWRGRENERMRGREDERAIGQEDKRTIIPRIDERTRIREGKNARG